MEKINIAELLKDCPKGMELDSPVLIGKITFGGINSRKDYPIRVNVDSDTYCLTRYGQIFDIDTSGCIIFPKGKTTWEGFQRPFKDGDVVVTTLGNIAIIKEPIGTDYFAHAILFNDNMSFYDIITKVCVARLATEEEKEKLFQAIKENGYKWDAETKISEKEEKKDKFDITTLKPFESRVLIRDRNNDEWRGHFFSHHYKGSDRPYICIGQEGLSEYRFCIPFEGNEHLLGKTEDCEEFYKTWK